LIGKSRKCGGRRPDNHLPDWASRWQRSGDEAVGGRGVAALFHRNRTARL